MKENNFVSAAIYLDESSDHIYEFLKMANDVFKRNFKNWEYICIGAGLENEVFERIKKFKQENEDATVSLIDMGFPQGLETAMNAGTDLAIFSPNLCSAFYLLYQSSYIQDSLS